jgi:anti-sigma B factor antagonist
MPEADLSCYTRQDGAHTIAALEGCLDVLNAPRAVKFLEEFIEKHGPQVSVDTSRLDFIDSKGIGALLSAAKTARDAGGHLAIPDPNLPVRKILEACGLLSLFAPQGPRGKADARAKSA